MLRWKLPQRFKLTKVQHMAFCFLQIYLSVELEPLTKKALYFVLTDIKIVFRLVYRILKYFISFCLHLEPTIAQDIVVAICAVVVVFLLCIIGFVLFWKLRHSSCSKDPEFENKLTANSRLSSDDTSIDGMWDESNKHSLSVFK